MTSRRTSTSRGDSRFDRGTYEQSSQEAASQSSWASTSRGSIAPSSLNQGELNPLQSLQRTRLARSTEDHSVRSGTYSSFGAQQVENPHDSRTYASWAASRVGSQTTPPSTTAIHAPRTVTGTEPLSQWHSSLGFTSAPWGAASLQPSLSTSRFAPASSRPLHQVINSEASHQNRLEVGQLATAKDLNGNEKRRLATALSIVADDVLSALSDGTKTITEISRSYNTPSLLKYVHTDGSLSAGGTKAFSLLSSEQRARFDAATAQRRRTLKNGLLGLSRGGNTKSGQPPHKTAFSSIMADDALSAFSDGKRTIKEISQSYNFPSLATYLRTDGSLTTRGAKALSLLSSEQRARFDAATAQRQQTLKGSLLGNSRGGYATAAFKRSSTAAPNSLPSPAPSFFEGLTPYFPENASSPGSVSQEIPDDWISQLRSGQSPHRSVASRTSRHSSPRGSSIFDGLSTPGTSFVLPEGSHAFSSRPASADTEAALNSVRSEITDSRFIGVAEGLGLTDHINTLDDLALYANVSVAPLQRLVSERTMSGGSTRLQLTSLGDTYVSRFASAEQRYGLSRVSANRSAMHSRPVDELRSARTSRSDMSDRFGSSQSLNRWHEANIGHASGEGLNCLLDTIVQLRDNVRRRPNEETSQTRQIDHEAQRIRNALVATGAVRSEGEIDIYGGAGAQLANDLNLRIQVTQRTADGSVITHPILGQAGRLVHVLHTPGHFQPLWQHSVQEQRGGRNK